MRSPDRSTLHLFGQYQPKPRPAQAPTPLGDTFNETEDGARLETQYFKVAKLMKDGAWRTLREIHVGTDEPEASISARLRDMRRDGWVVERRKVPGQMGLWEYRATRRKA